MPIPRKWSQEELLKFGQKYVDEVLKQPRTKQMFVIEDFHNAKRATRSQFLSMWRSFCNQLDELADYRENLPDSDDFDDNRNQLDYVLENWREHYSNMECCIEIINNENSSLNDIADAIISMSNIINSSSQFLLPRLQQYFDKYRPDVSLVLQSELEAEKIKESHQSSVDCECRDCGSLVNRTLKEVAEDLEDMENEEKENITNQSNTDPKNPNDPDLIGSELKSLIKSFLLKNKINLEPTYIPLVPALVSILEGRSND